MPVLVPCRGVGACLQEGIFYCSSMSQPQQRLAMAFGLSWVVVTMWACQIELLRDVKTWDGCDPATAHRKCPWSNPIFVGCAVKMVFVATLPPALLVRRAQWRRCGHTSAPLIDRRFFWLSSVLTLFLLGTSITWVASIPLTLPAVNSALYQLYTPFTYVFSIPILREACSASKTIGVLLALCAVLMILESDAMVSAHQEGNTSAADGRAASNGEGRAQRPSGELLVRRPAMEIAPYAPRALAPQPAAQPSR